MASLLAQYVSGQQAAIDVQKQREQLAQSRQATQQGALSGQLQKAKLLGNTIDAVARLPINQRFEAVQRVRPELQKMGVELPEIGQDQLTDEALATHKASLAGFVQNQQQASSPNIGTYNPRDYTVGSFSEFVKTNDPGVLVREKGPSLDEKLQFEIDKEKGKLGAQTDAAEEKKFKEQLGVSGAKVYADLQNAAQQASAFIPRLQSLKTLASKVSTGSGAEIRMAAKKALGIDSSDMEELNAKLGELAQDILNQQTGTKTDFDFQNAVRQSASLGKTKEANVRLIKALIDRQLEAVNFGDMAREAYELGGVKGVLDMRFSAPLQNGGIATPQTQQDFDALPSGAIYIDPDDGKQYRKP